jgi:hypothetical protein
MNLWGFEKFLISCDDYVACTRERLIAFPYRSIKDWERRD